MASSMSSRMRCLSICFSTARTTWFTSEVLRLQYLTAAERQQLPREGGSPLRCEADLCDILVHRLRPPRGFGQQYSAVARDDGQQVVEVVRDAASQLPYRLHLLGVPQLRLQRVLLRHVACVEYHAADRRIVQQVAHRPSEGPPCTRGVPQAEGHWCSAVAHSRAPAGARSATSSRACSRIAACRAATRRGAESAFWYAGLAYSIVPSSPMIAIRSVAFSMSERKRRSVALSPLQRCAGATAPRRGPACS